MNKLLSLVFVLGLLAVGGGVIWAATTNLSHVMSSGTKTVTADASAVFAAKTVSISADTTTASYGITATNEIGDGAKYDVTMTSTNLATIGGVQLVAGSNSTVGTSGTYDGTYGVTTPVSRYEIEITTGGAVGTALFTWTVDGAGGATGVSTAATVTLEKGVSATFAAATYLVGDRWEFGVDAFPYTSMTVAPQTITAVSGVTTNMTAGSSENLAGTGVTSDAKNLFTTEYYRGMGQYTQTQNLTQTIQANPVAGTYSADATITIL